MSQKQSTDGDVKLISHRPFVSSWISSYMPKYPSLPSHPLLLSSSTLLSHFLRPRAETSVFHQHNTNRLYRVGHYLRHLINMWSTRFRKEELYGDREDPQIFLLKIQSTWLSPSTRKGTKESEPKFHETVFANRTFPTFASIFFPGKPIILYIWNPILLPSDVSYTWWAAWDAYSRLQ